MKNTWVVNGNSSVARIYEYNQKENSLHLLKELYHEDSRKKGIDLVTDCAHRFGRQKMQASLTSRTKPKESEAEFFAIEIAKILENARTNRKMDNLILLA